MVTSKRQMHLGVFVLGTGNHSAGWRYEGAATSGCSLPVMKQIANIAERGKFDLFFISDSLVMEQGDHPSSLNRFARRRSPNVCLNLANAFSARL